MMKKTVSPLAAGAIVLLALLLMGLAAWRTTNPPERAGGPASPLVDRVDLQSGRSVSPNGLAAR